MTAALWLLAAASPSLADDTLRRVRVTDSAANYNIASSLSYMFEPTLDLGIKGVIDPNNHARFKYDGRAIMTHGFNSSAIWAAFELQNTSDERRWYLEFTYPLLDMVDVYMVTEDGRVKRYERVGDSAPFVRRQVQVPQLVVPLDVPTKSVVRIYFRVHTNGVYLSPITLHNAVSFMETLEEHQTRNGLYFGGLTILALYNLLLFAYFRLRQHLVFSGLTIAMIIWFFGEAGLLSEYFFPTSPQLCNHIMVLALFSISTLGFLFNYVFLKDALSTGTQSFLKGSCYLSGTLLLLSQFMHYALGTRIGICLVILYLSSSLVVSLRALTSGYLPARMFFLSNICAVLGGTVMVLRDLGVLSSATLSLQGPLLGISLFILLLSLALTDQISIVQKTKDAISESFAKFVPRKLVAQLLETGQVARLGGEEREVTVLFSDLRGYSTIIETLKPDEVIQLLTEYFDHMQACVEANNGVILEFVGDGILAVFGAPAEVEEHPSHAVTCALEMQSALDELNEQWEATEVSTIWKRHGIERLSMRIGLHTGTVIAGNVGSQRTMKYGIVGDAVNVAARLEALNNHTGTRILLTTQTRDHLGDEQREQTAFEGDFTLKGRNQKQGVYSVGGPAHEAVADLESVNFSVMASENT